MASTKPFEWSIRHFPDIRLLTAYLQSLQRPIWCSGITLHHTFIPTVAQWRGYASMVGLGNYYRDDVLNPNGTRGWPSGPHIFIGPDGIWQGTPLIQRGTHAGVCNTSRIGIEVVGNYDSTPWQEPINSFVYQTVVELLRWLRLDERAINGHRDCASTKTCPGSAINLDTVRSVVKARLNPPPAEDQPVIGVAPSITADQLVGMFERHHAQVSEDEARFIHLLAERNQVDPAFLGAVWKHEGGSPLGGSPLQQLSNMPINVKAAPGEWRKTVSYNGAKWLWAESPFQGLQYSIWHLKNVHGAAGRLTVHQIIPVHAPASDTNSPESFIKSVLEDMRYMAAQK